MAVTQRSKRRLTARRLVAASVAAIGVLLSYSPMAAPVPAGKATGEARFGIDYVFALGPYYRNDLWPRQLAEAGARWVNFAGIPWKHFEPRPPRNGQHRYHWDRLDREIRRWQQYGFDIVLWLRLGDGWFAGPVRYRPLGDTLLMRDSDRLPRPEYMDDYRAWVSAIVERYDGDGQDDMPELRRPIRHYQCGNEYANPMFWTGTLEDYVTLLHATCTAARAAYPDVRMVSNGMRWNNFFHDDPEAKLVDERWKAFLARLPNDMLRDGWRRNLELNLLTLRHADLVDVIDVGGNGAWPSMSAGYFTWVRRELVAAWPNGPYPELWEIEARCEPPLVSHGDTSFHPDLVVPGGKRIVTAMKKKSDPDHAAAIAWYRAEQARTCVQVFVTRFAAGAQKVFMGMPGDWDGTMAALTAPNPFLGLMTRKGEPWPAFYAMKQLAQAIDGFGSAKRLPAPSDVELYEFRFPAPQPPVWIAWLAESRCRGMKEALPHRHVSLPGLPSTATVSLTPTALGEQPKPRAEELRRNGPLTLDLTPTPVIIRP